MAKAASEGRISTDGMPAVNTVAKTNTATYAMADQPAERSACTFSMRLYYDASVVFPKFDVLEGLAVCRPGAASLLVRVPADG
jgi:hypothetical protein